MGEGCAWNHAVSHIFALNWTLNFELVSLRHLASNFPIPSLESIGFPNCDDSQRHQVGSVVHRILNTMVLPSLHDINIH